MKSNLTVLLLYFMCMCTVSGTAQLNVMEYFFDQDPGAGNGTLLQNTISNSGLNYDLLSYTGSIQIPAYLDPGMHTLCIRSGAYVNGVLVWGGYETKLFKVRPSDGNSIIAAEYFIDQDPGIGNGVSINLSPTVDSADYSGAISTTGLSTGKHTVSVRTKNKNGRWSLYQTRDIQIINNNSGSGIVQLEYFFDQDPGIGNGIAIPVSGTATSSEYTGTLTTTGLSSGYHVAYIRSKNAAGQWSLYEGRKIHVLDGGNAIVAAEYFYDTDPGFGNGQSISINSLASQADYTGSIATSGLSAGKHTLSVRVKNIQGAWSTYETRKITVNPSVVIGEYFFDQDPGVGNATAYTLSPTSLSTSELNGSLLTPTNLLHGQHWLYIRALTPDGSWGHYDSLGVYVNCSNPIVGQVMQSPVINSCGEEGVELSLVNSFLNEGAQWSWYSGGCGSVLEATGSTVFVQPNDTTTYYVRGEGGCTNVFTCTTVPVNYNPASHLDLKLFLEGYYVGAASMQTTLANEGQPTCAGITDTVMVDLVDPISQNIVHTQKAILHTNGKLRCNFQPFTGEYYVGIRHRNSIETWSSIPIYLDNNLTTYDFTTHASKAFLGNMKEVDTNTWAFYSGDVNQDDVIDVFDYLIMDPDIVNGAGGYLSTDLNGDGSVDAFDYLMVDPNIEQGVGAALPF